MKSPAQSASRWDVYSLVSTIPPEITFRPMYQGGYPLVTAVVMIPGAAK